jgi:phosphate transport system protein
MPRSSIQAGDQKGSISQAYGARSDHRSVPSAKLDYTKRVLSEISLFVNPTARSYDHPNTARLRSTMRELFQQELHEVQDRLVEIAQLVVDAITDAVEAFNKSDVTLAESVIVRDNKIDDAVVALDELAIAIMARQAPVAKDLRIVVSALRISASLERMGDMAEHVAQLARYRFPEKVVPKTIRPIFKEMGALDIELAKMLVVLLKTEDVAIAEKIRDEDDKVDALHLSVFETVLSDSWSQGTETTVDATLASRYLERFADHAVSIAKKMMYLATGEWNPPKH